MAKIKIVRPEELQPTNRKRPGAVIEFVPRLMRDTGIGYLDEGEAEAEDLKKYPVVLRPWINKDGLR